MDKYSTKLINNNVRRIGQKVFFVYGGVDVEKEKKLEKY
jgi:hypothetical protein